MFGLLCTPLVYSLGPLCSFFLHIYKVCFLPIKKKKKGLNFGKKNDVVINLFVSFPALFSLARSKEDRVFLDLSMARRLRQ